MKNCKQCSTSFEITDQDRRFYQKIDVPEPQLCPECRQIRRMAFRNECVLYKRNCDLCQKSMISTYSPDKPYPVYCQDCFWSDQWNPLDYGRGYDFDRPFFEQWSELRDKAPRLGIVNKQSQNSDYCNYSFSNKNCYLTFGSHYEEDCMYGHYATENKNCMDCYWLYRSELCYEAWFSKNCYRSAYLDHCEDSRECFFSVDLKGCKNCVFSSNLRHKQYYILNKPHTKEEYFEKLKSFNWHDYGRFQEAIAFYTRDFRKRFPFRATHQTNCENCEGNNHQNSKNLKNCFYSRNSEDCAYGYMIDETYSSMDMNCMGYDRCEVCYNTIGCTGTFNCICCDSCWHDSDLMYCNLCFSSKNLFGCIGLNQKQYCMLNKQYSKEEYEKLLSKIKKHMKSTGEWGEFFPVSISPYAYNETIAQDYFPLNKQAVVNHGWKWKEADPKKFQPQTCEIPSDINNVQDDILKETLACIDCRKNYKLIPLELKFYRELQIPVPKKCPDCRRSDRIKLMTPLKLWNRNCAKCQKAIQTTHAPDRPETVYCEECYLKEVY